MIKERYKLALADDEKARLETEALRARIPLARYIRRILGLDKGALVDPLHFAKGGVTQCRIVLPLPLPHRWHHDWRWVTCPICLAWRNEAHVVDLEIVANEYLDAITPQRRRKPRAPEPAPAGDTPPPETVSTAANTVPLRSAPRPPVPEPDDIDAPEARPDTDDEAPPEAMADAPDGDGGAEEEIVVRRYGRAPRIHSDDDITR